MILPIHVIATIVFASSVLLLVPYLVMLLFTCHNVAHAFVTIRFDHGYSLLVGLIIVLTACLLPLAYHCLCMPLNSPLMSLFENLVLLLIIISLFQSHFQPTRPTAIPSFLTLYPPKKPSTAHPKLT